MYIVYMPRCPSCIPISHKATGDQNSRHLCQCMYGKKPKLTTVVRLLNGSKVNTLAGYNHSVCCIL